MLFTMTFYVALTVFIVGTGYKVSTWFRYTLDPKAENFTPARRAVAAIRGILAVLLSRKIVDLLRVFLIDALLQLHIFRRDRLRWIMHMSIYGGFMMLLLFHALDTYVTSRIFDGYYSSVNPFLFVRDLSGCIVIIGLGIAVYRRFFLGVTGSNAMDVYAIVILSLIMVSGFLLKGSNIISYTRFQEMVSDYGNADDQEETTLLEAYWVAGYGVVSPNIKSVSQAGSFNLEQGREVHQASCAECHSRPQSAFISYAAAKILTPSALKLDRLKFFMWMWYLHFLSCWIGLAYLPFSKMFHIFTGPVSIMANAIMDRSTSDPANIATRQIMELDACVHCGTCTQNCSVAVVSGIIDNVNVLPSEKIGSIRQLVTGSDISENETRRLLEGVYLCTSCLRCTVSCPVGINLQELWISTGEALLGRGIPEFLVLSPLSYYRGLTTDRSKKNGYRKALDRHRQLIASYFKVKDFQDRPIALPQEGETTEGGQELPADRRTFSYCFGCETCTSVCPVVGVYHKPAASLGLLPHQIMNACGLGLKEMALSCNMLWDCLTCYQCQEHCPQGVRVTDVLYELKNESIKRVKINNQ